ncbi:STAS domain-containing protein [Aliidiomarina taiwanensis]|nr:STAS domain-containing protein [Aliidiomarina taiwanensis]
MNQTQQNDALSFEHKQGAVFLQGGLNRDTVPQAWHTRRDWATGEGVLTLNLAGVEKVDSAGLAMLIQLKAELGRQNRELALQDVSKQLLAFAEVSGVTALLSLT